MFLGLFTALLLLGGVEYAVRSGLYTMIPEKYLSASSVTDYSLHTSYRMAMLKRQPPESTAVYIFGGSTGRAAFTEEVLSSLLTKAMGKPVACYNLSLNGAFLKRDWVLLDNLPAPREKSYVAVSIGMNRFARSLIFSPTRGNEVFLPQADYVTELADKIRYSLALPAVATKVFLYIKNNAPRFIKGKAPEKMPENYFHGTGTAERAQKSIGTYLSVVMPNYEKNLDKNLLLFSDLLDAIAARGFVPLVINMPLNNTHIQGQWDRMLTYAPKVEDICAAKGVAFIDYQASLSLPWDSFTDVHHMNGEGRKVFNARFAEDLSRLMLEEAVATGLN